MLSIWTSLEFCHLVNFAMSLEKGRKHCRKMRKMLVTSYSSSVSTQHLKTSVTRLDLYLCNFLSRDRLQPGNRIHSSQMTDCCFNEFDCVGKQPVAWKENCEFTE